MVDMRGKPQKGLAEWLDTGSAQWVVREWWPCKDMSEGLRSLLLSTAATLRRQTQDALPDWGHHTETQKQHVMHTFFCRQERSFHLPQTPPVILGETQDTL